MNVLVIEDEPTSLKLVHLVLAAEGHQVSDAEAAEKALEMINKDKPQIILLDLALPGVDGLALTRKLKQNPKTRDIPIIAVTAYPDRFSKLDAIKAGCDAYLVKPINTRVLPGQVAEMVSKKSGD